MTVSKPCVMPPNASATFCSVCNRRCSVAATRPFTVPTASSNLVVILVIASSTELPKLPTSLRRRVMRDSPDASCI